MASTQDDVKMSTVAVDGSESWQEPSCSSSAAAAATTTAQDKNKVEKVSATDDAGGEKAVKRKRTRKRKKKDKSDAAAAGSKGDDAWANAEEWGQDGWGDDTQQASSYTNSSSVKKHADSSIDSTVVDQVATPFSTQQQPQHISQPSHSGGNSSSTAPHGQSNGRRNADDDGRDFDGLVRGAKRDRKGHKIFVFGNYDAYYSYRSLPDATSDGRLDAVKRAYGEDFFEGKQCLDIGCNAGWVTMQLSKACRAKQVVGVDIDVNLVAKSIRELRREREVVFDKLAEKTKSSKLDEKKDNQSDDSKKTKVGETKPHASDEEVVASSDKNTSVDKVFKPPAGCENEYPWNVEFHALDMANVNLSDGCPLQEGSFDVICAFSMTKWVHFNFGDAGIKRLFANVRRLLAPNGIFVLEPQEFRSYKKKRMLTETFRENWRNIQLKPQHFSQYLQDTYGFAALDVLKPDKDAISALGFDRPLQIFRAPAEPYVDSGATTKDFERESWMFTQQSSANASNKQNNDSNSKHSKSGGQESGQSSTQEMNDAAPPANKKPKVHSACLSLLQRKVVPVPLRLQQRRNSAASSDLSEQEHEIRVDESAVSHNSQVDTEDTQPPISQSLSQHAVSQSIIKDVDWADYEEREKQKLRKDIKKNKVVPLTTEGDQDWRANQLALLSKFMKKPQVEDAGDRADVGVSDVVSKQSDSLESAPSETQTAMVEKKDKKEKVKKKKKSKRAEIEAAS